jgi:hypothetical protein
VVPLVAQAGSQSGTALGADGAAAFGGGVGSDYTGGGGTGASTATVCEVRVRVEQLDAGRLMIKALTMSVPRPGNRSVSTSSLYALP